MKASNLRTWFAGDPRVDGFHTQNANARWHWLYRVSGTAATITGVLFLIAVASLIIAMLQPGVGANGLAQLQHNWLMVLFQLNAGFAGVQFDQLYGQNPLDITLLTLVAIVFLGLYIALRRPNRVWPLIATLQPILGLVLFLATKQAGRSAVMGAVLVISLVMLRNHCFSKVTATMGILAGVVLLIGDFNSTPSVHSNSLALLIGIGYLILMSWFFLIAGRLLQLSTG